MAVKRSAAGLLFGALLLTLLLAACGGGDGDGNDLLFSETPGPTLAAAGPPSCGPSTSAIAGIERRGERSFSAPPEVVIDPGKRYTAHLVTAKGEVEVELAADLAPLTVNNFVFLSCSGFYDGLTFHRFDPNFVIQGGDPNGNGRGGPGYSFADEFSAELRHDGAGVLSMANRGANSNGSQFFITLGPAPHLDGRHSVFGSVSGGMDVVRAIRAGDRIVSVSVSEE